MMTPFARCYCGSTRFAPGPRGGASWNIACVACGHRFNVVLRAGLPPLLVDDLGPSEVPETQPWTIEVGFA